VFSFYTRLYELSSKKFQLFFLLAPEASPDDTTFAGQSGYFLIKEATKVAGRWEKIAAERSAEEMERFAYLRLLTRALGISHEVLADRLGFVRPFDAQEALRGRREHTADEIAIELLDAWRASRRKYLDAARYMDSLLAELDESTPDQV
jgi:hypothetical protein